MENFDEILKAKLQYGEEFDSESDRDIEAINRLIQSNDWLLEAIIGLQETLENSKSQNYNSTSVPNLSPSTEQSYINNSSQNFDQQNFLASTIPGYLSPDKREEFRNDLQKREEEIKQHLNNITQLGSNSDQLKLLQEEQLTNQHEQQKLQEIELQEEKLVNDFMSQIRTLFGSGVNVGGQVVDYGFGKAQSVLGSIESQFTNKAVNSLSNELGGGFGSSIAQFLPTIINSFKDITLLGTQAVGLSTSLVTLTTSVVAVSAILGVLNATDVLNKRNDYQKSILQYAPGSYSSFSDGSGLTPARFYEEAKKSLIISRSEDDVKGLLNSVLSSRPNKDTTQGELQNISYIFGYLQDMGLSPGKSSSTLMNMQNVLNMTTEASVGQLVNIANTAKVHSLDLNTYVEKITQATIALRGLGVTVETMNDRFEGYMNKVMPNGEKLNMDEAIKATSIEMGLGKNASIGEAIYAARTTGANLKVGSSLGIHGTGDMTLGEMAGQGGMGAYMAGLYLKSSSPLAFAAIGQRNLKDIQKLFPQLNGNEDAQKVMLSSMMQRKGLISGDISDPAVSAVLDKIIKNQNESPEKIASSLGKEVEKLIPKPLDKVIEELGNVFGEEFKKGRDGLLKEYNRMLGWQNLWEDINNMLGATFLPLVLRFTAELSAIGEGLTKLGTEGFSGASKAYNESKKYWGEQYKDLLSSPDIQEYLKKSPFSEMMLNFSGFDENKNQAITEFQNNSIFNLFSDIGHMGFNALTNPLHTQSMALSLKGLEGHGSGYTKEGETFSTSLIKNKLHNLRLLTKDKATLAQSAFLELLDKTGVPFSITALSSQHGHSDGRGGEHKHGNAIDISISELTKNQRIALDNALSSNPYVDKVGFTQGDGRGDHISFNKARHLPGHKDHYHVTLKPGASNLVKKQIADQLNSHKHATHFHNASNPHLPSRKDKHINQNINLNLVDDHKAKKAITNRKINSKSFSSGSK